MKEGQLPGQPAQWRRPQSASPSIAEAASVGLIPSDPLAAPIDESALSAAFAGDAIGLDRSPYAAPSEPPRTAPAVQSRSRATSRRFAISLLVGGDLVGAGLALVLAQFAGQLVSGDTPGPAILAVLYAPIFVVVMGAYGLYHRPQRRLVTSSFPDIGRILHAIFVANLIVLLGSGAVHRYLAAPPVNRAVALVGGGLALVTIPVVRTAMRLAVRPDFATSKVLVVGSGQVAGLVVGRLAKVPDIDVAGYVDAEPTDVWTPEPSGVPHLGRLADLPAVIEHWSIDHVIVAFSAANEGEIAAELRLVPGHVRISVVPRMFDLLTIRSKVDDLRGLPVMDVAPAALGLLDRCVKRAMDIGISILILVLTAPLIAAIAIAVKLTSKGPVLFSQQRAGRDNRPFRIHKFRSMYQDAERAKEALANDVDGPLFKAHDDPRVTPVGRVLRKLSLDELPQLFNVLKGDMSLVGPRPFVLSESSQIDGWAARRFDVRPGMTGVWQVSGRNDLPFEELRRLDYLYVASWSLWWDLAILWRTPGRVLNRDGAY
jgi:exopolysaccharide biosynthesis polyprenyl glycosylphosphotransferase